MSKMLKDKETWCLGDKSNSKWHNCSTPFVLQQLSWKYSCPYQKTTISSSFFQGFLVKFQFRFSSDKLCKLLKYIIDLKFGEYIFFSCIQNQRPIFFNDNLAPAPQHIDQLTLWYIDKEKKIKLEICIS